MPIVGVDVSKKKLDSVLLMDPERVKVRSKVVANNASGFEQLLAFACRHGRCAPENLHFVMEATGVASSVNNASIAFADEDDSPLSRALATAFFPPEFQPVVQIEPGSGSAQMDAGRFLFVVAVPPGFEKDVRAGRNRIHLDQGGGRRPGNENGTGSQVKPWI